MGLAVGGGALRPHFEPGTSAAVPAPLPGILGGFLLAMLTHLDRIIPLVIWLAMRRRSAATVPKLANILPGSGLLVTPAVYEAGVLGMSMLGFTLRVGLRAGVGRYLLIVVGHRRYLGGAKDGSMTGEGGRDRGTTPGHRGDPSMIDALRSLPILSDPSGESPEALGPTMASVGWSGGERLFSKVEECKGLFLPRPPFLEAARKEPAVLERVISIL